VDADPIGANVRNGVLTAFVNLLDLCAIVVPSRLEGHRMPCGLQLVAPAWRDGDLDRLALGLESGEVPPPEPDCTLVVVGAHLSGQPLNHQLVERRAVLLQRTTTAAHYRLFALAGTSPAKPGLVRAVSGGAAIEVEVWGLDVAAFGSFVHAVPPPLCIGTVELADGTQHHGFLCEPWALDGATEITEHGGWRTYLAS
jgi:allophanate hydrolase